MMISKVLIVLCLTCAVAVAKDCQISIKDDIPKIEPVYLVSKDSGSTFQLFKPEGVLTTVPEGSKLHLLCAGRSNKITSLGTTSATLTCNGGLFKDEKNKVQALNSLECTSIPAAELQETSEDCGEDGLVYNSGFKHHDDEFATVFQICYNKDNQQVFYTNNVINGKSISNSISESKRRPFSASGMGKTTTAVNKLYTTQSQVELFEKLFGANQQYINSKSFLARGHLTPDADFVMRYEQLATYFYVNVKPEYQSVNAGNWLRVESAARNLAAQRQRDLTVYTGVDALLVIDGVAVYLDKDKSFDVPAYYYKVIKDESTGEAIVLITNTNPFAKDTKSLEFCNNVCKQANMYQAEFENAEKGYTFCCEFNDFSQNIINLPGTLRASKLLVK